MVRDIPFIPFPHPPDIYIRHGIVTKSDETERGRHLDYHYFQDGRVALGDVSQDSGVTVRPVPEQNANNPP